MDPADLALQAANSKASEAVGVDLTQMLGRRMADAFPGAMDGAVGLRPSDPIWRAAVEGVAGSTEFQSTDAGMTRRWFRADCVPLGKDVMVVYYHDVTQQVLAVEALSSASQLQTVLAALDLGVVVYAPDTAIVQANATARQLLGIQDIDGRLAADPRWRFLDIDEQPLPAENFPAPRVVSGQTVRGQLLVLSRPDGSKRVLEVNAVPRFGASGAVADVAVTFLDVTERELRRKEELQQMAELARLSVTDPLTGLANRRGIFQDAERARASALRRGEPLTVLMADLDQFKDINDQYGHMVGDQVLITVGELIRAQLRDEDVAGRVGGDEFLVVLPRTGLHDAQFIAERILATVAKFANSADFSHSQRLASSIGGAELSDHETVSQLVHRADRALYRAKRTGGGTVVLDDGTQGNDRPE